MSNAIAPGWYPDPQGHPQLRRWNGTEWEAYTVPLPGPGNAAVAMSAGAWALVALPLALAVAFPMFGQPMAALLALAVPGLAFVAMDMKAMQNQGFRLGWWGPAAYLLLGPLGYLWERAWRLRNVKRNTQANTVAAFLAAVAVAIGSYFGYTAMPVEMNGVLVESSIAAKLTSRVGSTVSVECPDSPRVEVGQTFTCIASASGMSIPVTVKVTSRDGDIVWAT